MAKNQRRFQSIQPVGISLGECAQCTQPSQELGDGLCVNCWDGESEALTYVEQSKQTVEQHVEEIEGNREIEPLLQVLASLECFQCGGLLENDDEHIRCERCGQQWRAIDTLESFQPRTQGRPLKFVLGQFVELRETPFTPIRHIGHTGFIKALPLPNNAHYLVDCSCGKRRWWRAGQLK